MYIDPLPKLRLSDIVPLSIRALVWLARASADVAFPQHRAVQIAGGVHMLRGLDYHHQQFLNRVIRLTPLYERREAAIKNLMGGRRDETVIMPNDLEQAAQDAVQHEMVAYLNRLGQFFTFAKALSVDAHLQRGSELMYIRNKHTAHRSIDAPRKEDTVQSQLNNAHLGMNHLAINSFPVFQLGLENKWIQFHMRDDHPIIMDESLVALQAIHPVAT